MHPAINAIAHSPGCSKWIAEAFLLIWQVEKMRVDIETVSPLTAGQTVCDIYHMSKLPKNVTVAKVLDCNLQLPFPSSKHSVLALHCAPFLSDKSDDVKLLVVISQSQNIQSDLTGPGVVWRGYEVGSNFIDASH